MRYIVDGHNLMHAVKQRFRVADGDAARWRVARELDVVAALPAASVTIVFDGRRGGGEDPAFRGSGLEVIYSTEGMTADLVIERLVTNSADPAAICVVTNDFAERRYVEAAGGSGMSCEQFMDWVDGVAENMASSVRRRAAQRPKTTLGDFFPDA